MILAHHLAFQLGGGWESQGVGFMDLRDISGLGIISGVPCCWRYGMITGYGILTGNCVTKVTSFYKSSGYQLFPPPPRLK